MVFCHINEVCTFISDEHIGDFSSWKTYKCDYVYSDNYIESIMLPGNWISI
jgi:hypothetical protein